MAKTAKLHELLAVDGNQKGQADKARGDLAQTFEKKRHLFTEKLVTFHPDGEGAVSVTEEQLDIQTTVRKELAWLADLWAKAIDTAYQVDLGNTAARADIVLDDGTVMATSVPATALLQLEKRTNEMHDLVSRIPTLDPAKGFEPDPAKGKGIYRARVDTRTRMKKSMRVVVGYEATKEHPAQVQYVNEDVPVGRIQTQEWSGMITPAEKAEMFDRVERLRRAIKSARARANEQVVSATDTIGDTLLKFVFGS